jgi:tetratricopeptide (TPR) repeat protein
MQLGARLIRARNLDQAENAFATAARLDPDSRSAYQGIVTVARQRELSPAETVDRLAPLWEGGAPTALGARLAAARVYREAGLLAKARDQIWRTVAIRGGGDVSFEMGMVALQANLPEIADAELANAVQAEPYNADNWLWLARARAQIGRHYEAVDTIRQGLSKLDPSGQFAPPAQRLPETAAVRATEIKRSERAPLLAVMAESLIALGQPAEALAVMDEAVDAKKDDPWLLATRAAADAGVAGAAANLLSNPGFFDETAWSLRSPEWSARPLLTAVTDGAPTFSDGQASVTGSSVGGRVMIQEVHGIASDTPYRLTARVRGDGLGPGKVFLALRWPHGPLPMATAQATTSATEWTTLDVEGVFGDGNVGIAIVAVGLTDDAPAGARVIVDDVSLTRAR